MISFNLKAEIFEQKNYGISVSINLPSNLIRIDPETQTDFYKKTKVPIYNPQSEDYVYQVKDIWFDEDYFKKFENEYLPDHLIITSQFPNVLSRNNLQKMRSDLEKDYDKVFVNGYAVYLQFSEYDRLSLDQESYFKNPKKIYNLRAVIILPELRIASIFYATDKEVSNSEFIKSINIYPRAGIREYLDIHGEAAIPDIEIFKENINNYIENFNKYFDIITKQNEVIKSTEKSILSHFKKYENNEINLDTLDKSITTDLEKLENSKEKINTEIDKISRRDFSNFMDGRYEYYNNEVEIYINNKNSYIFDLKVNYLENLNRIKNGRKIDKNKFSKFLFKADIFDLEQEQILINLKNNTIWSENNSIININNIRYNIYEINKKIINFLIFCYDNSLEDIILEYKNIEQLNKNLLSLISLELEKAEFQRQKYYDFQLEILSKQNESLVQKLDFLDKNLINTISLMQEMNLDLKKFLYNSNEVIDFDSYSEFFSNYSNLKKQIDLHFENYKNLVLERNIIALEFNKEIQKINYN